jgi:NTE family protein
MTSPTDRPAGDVTAAAATARVQETYTARPRAQRHGVALCLSGGGYRATLFHQGALRRLNEVAALSKLTTISSVSGGSIVAGLLADRLSPWPAPDTAAPDWDGRVSGPIRAFTRRNIRTWPVLKRLLPWNWLRSSTGVRTLAGTYQRRLTRLLLAQLPERPRFVLCATDMAFGVNWVFERTRMGDYQAGYAPPAEWPLARAVAASSCFPPVFNPLPIGAAVRDALRGGRARDPLRSRVLRDLRLTDGGVYDNMGLEPVWKDHALVLVSDGGSPFTAVDDRNLFQRLGRYVAVQGNQSGALRKRWLIASFLDGTMEGTYWGIASDVASYSAGAVGYGNDLVKDVIAGVRTDLDAFSDAEQAVLENHGYLLCEAALTRHVPGLARPVPLASPHPDWMDEDRVRYALRDSHKRKIFGRHGA